MAPRRAAADGERASSRGGVVAVAATRAAWMRGGAWYLTDIGSAGGVAGIIPEVPELELAHPDKIIQDRALLLVLERHGMQEVRERLVIGCVGGDDLLLQMQHQFARR